MNPKKHGYAWERGKVYDLTDLGWGVLRAVRGDDVPVVDGRFVVSVVRAGSVGSDYAAFADEYAKYLTDTNRNHIDHRKNIIHGYLPAVRLYVLESDWQKVVVTENEFGIVSP